MKDDGGTYNLSEPQEWLYESWRDYDRWVAEIIKMEEVPWA
jgi:hypothetical protein